jgi:hypothetical protein
VSIMRSKPRKRKSTIWLGSETSAAGPTFLLGVVGPFAVLGSHSLTPPFLV